MAPISLHDELKGEIVVANVLPTLIKLLATSESKQILLQVCKLCASLALAPLNKWLISNSGCLHGMLDLVLGNGKEIDEFITYAALCGVTNSISGSDANRRLVVDLNGIKPLISTIQYNTQDHIILEALKGLANIAFCNKFTAGYILSMGGEQALVEVLQTSDILRQPLIAHAIMSTMSNICYTESTQSHIGSTPGLIEAAVRLCEYGRCVCVCV